MRILIAEDDDISRRTLSGLLSKFGHEVIETTNGLEAWQELQKPDAPRLAILDWMMPKMNGLEVVRRVRELEANPPLYLIMLTAMNEVDDTITGLDAGADDYMTKPFEAGLLKARVNVGRRMIEMQEQREAQMEVRLTLERKLQQARKAESLGNMAGAIAHDFNNMLMAVSGNLELAMLDQTISAGSVEKLTHAMSAARRAAEVSGLMLTYLGQTPARREPLDLSEVCRLSLPLLQAAMQKGVELKTSLLSPGPIIRANAHQITQILTNLVTNAREALGEGMAAIHLAVKTVTPADIPATNRFPLDWQPQENHYACLEGTDSGCGIDEKDIENLFDPFFSSKFTGRGLGLPVVLGIVRSHSGAVTVESRAGSGSIFRVFLPLSAEAVPLQPVKADHRADMELEFSGTVLLVEDDPRVLKMTAAMLSLSGFAVLEAKDGMEAVALFRQNHETIRFVLSDLTMPRMDGWETLDALRQIVPGIPVILASGYDQASVMSEIHAELPQVFLGKPYNLTALQDAIRKVLER